MEWNILGTVTKEIEASDGTVHTYEIKTDKDQTFVRNGAHIHHSEMADKDKQEQS